MSALVELRAKSRTEKLPESAVLNPEITALATKCDSPTAFQDFDRLFRAVIAVPKAAVDKEEAKWKKARTKKRAKSNALG